MGREPLDLGLELEERVERQSRGAVSRSIPSPSGVRTNSTWPGFLAMLFGSGRNLQSAMPLRFDYSPLFQTSWHSEKVVQTGAEEG